MWQIVANYLLLLYRSITFSLPLNQPHKRIVVKYRRTSKTSCGFRIIVILRHIYQPEIVYKYKQWHRSDIPTTS